MIATIPGVALPPSMATTVDDLSRLCRCAASRPATTSRIVGRALRDLSAELAAEVGSVLSGRLGSLHEHSPRHATADGSTDARDFALALSSIRGGANVTDIERWSTSVEALRAAHGERQRWWGDLGAAEARALYHDLLPTSLLDDSSPYAAECTLSERARIAVAARRAARLYVRERTVLPVTLGCQLLDGFRQFARHGTFQPGGPSQEQLWEKYVARHAAEQGREDGADSTRAGVGGGGGDDARLHDEVCLTILRKACTSNRHVDFLCGAAGVPHATAATAAAAAREGEPEAPSEHMRGGHGA